MGNIHKSYLNLDYNDVNHNGLTASDIFYSENQTIKNKVDSLSTSILRISEYLPDIQDSSILLGSFLPDNNSNYFGTLSFVLSAVLDTVDISISKTYTVSVAHNATNGLWYELIPSTEFEGGNVDFAIDICANTTNVKLRLRRSALGNITTAHNHVINFEISHINPANLNFIKDSIVTFTDKPLNRFYTSNATSVGFNPHGNISANNVQQAVEELFDNVVDVVDSRIDNSNTLLTTHINNKIDVHGITDTDKLMYKVDKDGFTEGHVAVIVKDSLNYGVIQDSGKDLTDLVTDELLKGNYIKKLSSTPQADGFIVVTKTGLTDELSVTSLKFSDLSQIGDVPDVTGFIPKVSGTNIENKVPLITSTGVLVSSGKSIRSNLIELSDVPTVYGNRGETLVVNSNRNGVEWKSIGGGGFDNLDGGSARDQAWITTFDGGNALTVFTVSAPLNDVPSPPLVDPSPTPTVENVALNKLVAFSDGFSFDTNISTLSFTNSGLTNGNFYTGVDCNGTSNNEIRINCPAIFVDLGQEYIISQIKLGMDEKSTSLIYFIDGSGTYTPNHVPVSITAPSGSFQQIVSRDVSNIKCRYLLVAWVDNGPQWYSISEIQAIGIPSTDTPAIPPVITPVVPSVTPVDNVALNKLVACPLGFTFDTNISTLAFLSNGLTNGNFYVGIDCNGTSNNEIKVNCSPIFVDLGQEYIISQIKLGMDEKSTSKVYFIDGSGVFTSNHIPVTVIAPSGSFQQVVSQNVSNIKCRYILVTWEHAGQWYSISEIQAFGVPSNSTPTVIPAIIPPVPISTTVENLALNKLVACPNNFTFDTNVSTLSFVTSGLTNDNFYIGIDCNGTSNNEIKVNCTPIFVDLGRECLISQIKLGMDENSTSRVYFIGKDGVYSPNHIPITVIAPHGSFQQVVSYNVDNLKCRYIMVAWISAGQWYSISEIQAFGVPLE